MRTLSDPAWKRNERFAARLYNLVGAPPSPSEIDEKVLEDSGEFLDAADAVVAHVEINDKHGVGVLLRRLFRGCKDLLSIRSQDHYGGEQDFGDVALPIAHASTSRDAIFTAVLEGMQGHTVGRILAVPYYADDVRNAIALAEIYDAPLCTYLMDDQNICADGIPDELMAELLGKSRLRVAISPELATTYEMKYGEPMVFMPPVVTARHILSESRPVALNVAAPEGVIIGNIWGQRWLDLLRQTVGGSGVSLRWFANDHFRYLEGDAASLARDSIVVPEGPPLDDEPLIDVLRQAPFTVVPTGTLDEDDDRSFIAQLSLPSRIPFMLATSLIPVIVLGDERTGAARFVRDLGVGMVCPYESEQFSATVTRMMEPDTNRAMRERALAVASRFSDEGALEWLWRSLARGAPLDDRYEPLMPATEPDLQHLVNKP